MLFQPTHTTLPHHHHHQQQPKQNSFSMTSIIEQQQKSSSPPQQPSSRILYDIPCKVCTDHSSGKHYGIFACDGCAGFFKRSIRRGRQYVCKSKTEGGCLVDKTHRNQCRACRLNRCVAVGMNREAVQHERGPRNSTLRRQMSLFFKEHSIATASSAAATATAASMSPEPAEESPLSSREEKSSSPTSTSSPMLSFAQPPSPPMVLPMSALSMAVAAAASGQSPLSSVHPPPPPPPIYHYGPYSAHALLKPHLPPFFIDPRLAAAVAANASSAFHHPSVTSNVTGITSSSPTMMTNRHLLMPTPKYGIPAPPPPPAPAPLLHLPVPAPENISETAARLLFMNVRWAQHVPAFTSLPYRDQMTLLEETWRELFVLSAAQFHLAVEKACAADMPVPVLAELKAFQDAMQKFQSMGVDGTEFACLRAIVLLKTTLNSEEQEDGSRMPMYSRELRDQAAINALQDQAQLTLSKYIASAYPNQPSRFGKLLLLLPALRSVSARTVEEVFFKKTIGPIPLEKIICDMFKAGGGGGANAAV